MLEEIEIPLSIYLPKHFDNISDLGYTLVDIHSIINAFHHITTTQVTSKRLPVTSRNFNKKRKQLIRLIDFRSGSFGADLLVSILSGIVLKFIDKLIFNQQEAMGINISLNNNRLFKVEIHDHDQKQLIDDIVNRTQIAPNNTSQSIANLIDEINREQLLGTVTLTYNQTGLTILSDNIQRLGQLLDTNI
nr:hypothetical protein [uncultured Holophaga sp.]